MTRRMLVVWASMLGVLALLTGPAISQDGPGQGHGPPPEGDEGVCDERHNNLRSQADPIELDDGDVEEMTGTDDGEAITYWVVRHDVEHERAVYREPARLGPDNFCLADSDTDSFWFGIAGPDLTPIEHKGQTALYFEDESGDWHSLKVQFDGRGQLRHVNGVEPE